MRNANPVLPLYVICNCFHFLGRDVYVFAFVIHFDSGLCIAHVSALSRSLFLMKWCSVISFVGLQWFAEGLDWVAAWAAEGLQGSEGLEWVVEVEAVAKTETGGQGFGWLAYWQWVFLSRGKITGCKATSKASTKKRVLEFGRIDKGVRS
ncbi:hypothetical protein AMTRI_Chr02g259480 [Amborella trichopoda]